MGVNSPAKVSKFERSNPIVSIYTGYVVGTYRFKVTISDGILEDVASVNIDLTQDIRAKADAGADQDVNYAANVLLNGLASRDPWYCIYKLSE